MVTDHSYIATVGNNKTEASAVQFLLKSDPRFVVPDREQRKEILKRFDLPMTFSRAFDLVYLPEGVSSIVICPIRDLVLVELKTTQKKLVNNPDGFFFGATENEFHLADTLGAQYMFCFVSLHAESIGYVMLSSAELNNRIKTKRLQYQINI